MNQAPQTHTDIPANYPLCLHADCPQSESCLHQLAYRRHAEQRLYLRLINPTRCTKQTDCPHYACNRPVKFAKGFTNFQKRMYPDQYDKFMGLLVLHFGRNQYFKRRRGDIPLSPAEQEIIKIALKKSGVTQPLEFDSYVESINWKA